MAKRMRYDRIDKFTSSEESEDSNGDNQLQDSSDPDLDIQKFQSRRKPKCFSKNAEMARKNRLKKKIHLAKLEKKVDILKKEKRDLVNIIDTQAMKVFGLQKEVKYLKGVLANSSHLSNLIRNIQQSKEVPVSSPLNSSKKVCKGETSEPHEDSLIRHSPPLDPSLSNMNSLDDNLYLSSPFSGDYFLECFERVMSDDINNETQEVQYALDDHNYSSSLENEDYGICLHVRKNKLSLEFCSSCEENSRSLSVNQ